MDDPDDIPGSSILEGPETPEYSPTDSESSDTSEEADALERDTNRSLSHTDVDSHFSTPAAEETDVVGIEGVVDAKGKENSAHHLGDTSDSHLSNINERHSFEENMTNLDAEGEEECKEGFKEDLDGYSMLSGSSLDSEDNSKTSVVCKNSLERTDQDKSSVRKDCGNHMTDTEKNQDEECIKAKLRANNLQKGDFDSRDKKSKEEENGRTRFPLQISLDEESICSDIHSESVDDERVLSNEMLSDSEEQDLEFHCNDDSNTSEERKMISKALDELPQAELIVTPADGETQGQGDTSHSLTDVTSTGGTVHQQKVLSTEEQSQETKNERAEANGEQTQLKFPKTLEHVGEVPRGIFESILYKLYHRVNQRSPRTWRDVSRGPCVKELVKEFSKEAMDCPKFPKSQSVQVRKTQEEMPKSQLFESFSDMDDSPRSQPAQVEKTFEVSRKSPLFDSFSDIDDRGFESRIETSTDDERLSSDDVAIRSSTPSQEVVVFEIRDELQKPDCSRKKVIQLIKKFGGKGSFKKHNKNGDKAVKTEEVSELQLPMKAVVEGNANKDMTADNQRKSETLSQTACTRKGSSAWLTNVSVKNLVSIFSEISKSPVPPRRSASRSSKRCSVWPSKETLTKASRTMETQTPGSEAIGSCSNVLLLLQSEYNGSNMLSGRFERKRSTLSMCLPTTELEDCELDGVRPTADPLRACASATGLLLVSTAEPVRVRALCTPDDNRAALSQLAHLLHLPDRKAQPQGHSHAQARARSVARDSSLVRQMVAQWDRSSTST